MKNIIIMILIGLSFYSNAAADYSTNEDGSLVYVGDCTLHEDYKDKEFTTQVILPYLSYPTTTVFQRLTTDEFLMLRTLLRKEVVDPDSYEGIEMLGLDDLTINRLFLMNGNTDELYQFSYGVGGGNGGHYTFKLNRNGSIDLVAKTFDGELLSCSSQFKK